MLPTERKQDSSKRQDLPKLPVCNFVCNHQRCSCILLDSSKLTNVFLAQNNTYDLVCFFSVENQKQAEAGKDTCEPDQRKGQSET